MTGKKIFGGIVATAVFLLLGLGMLWGAMKYLKVEQDATLVALLVLPAILFLAFSGRLLELKVGPLEAKLEEPVQTAPNFTGLDDDSIDPVIENIQSVIKQGADRLPEIVRSMEEDRPPVLYLHLGKTYSPADVKAYTRDLSLFRRFKFVVIAGQGGRIIGYAPYHSLERIMNFEERAEALLRLIEDGNEEKIRRYPGIRATFLTPQTTYREALQLMIEEHLESLVVLDNKNKLKGVVEREQLLGQLLLAAGK